MTLLIVMPGREGDSRRLAAELRAIDGNITVEIWPEVGDPGQVEMIVAWSQPDGLWASFPNLRLVASFGAGVENLVGDSDLPASVAVVRTVDNSLAKGMAEYVVTAIAGWRRSWIRYRNDQAHCSWRPQTYPFSCTVLLLGVGRMGMGVADALSAVDHRVIGWGRTGRAVGDIEGISGHEALLDVVSQVDVTVCLLPLTPDTEDILDSTLFSRMKRGSLLINVGRGRHLVEDDLITALGQGRPKHAVLDVFREEPLPLNHPFWTHPAITITPHVAALTDPRGAAERIAENWRRLYAGAPLLDQVDREQGY